MHTMYVHKLYNKISGKTIIQEILYL